MESAELFGGKAAGKRAAAEMIRDADEEGGAGEEVGAAAEKDAAGCGAAQDGIGRGDVVSMEGNEEGNAETALDRQSRGGIDGEVRVKEHGVTALEREEEVGSEAGFEEEAAAESGGGRVGAREQQRLFGIDGEAGGEETESGKERRKTEQGAGLGGDKGFRWRQEFGAKDEDGGLHEEERAAWPRRGAMPRRELRMACGAAAAS